MGQWFFIHTKVNHTFIADDLQAKSSCSRSVFFDGIKKKWDAGGHLKAGMQFIASDGSNAFGSLLDVLVCTWSMILQQPTATGFRFTRKVTRDVEHMTPQDPQVETAASMILFASRADLEWFSDFTISDQLLDHW